MTTKNVELKPWKKPTLSTGVGQPNEENRASSNQSMGSDALPLWCQETDGSTVGGHSKQFDNTNIHWIASKAIEFPACVVESDLPREMNGSKARLSICLNHLEDSESPTAA